MNTQSDTFTEPHVLTDAEIDEVSGAGLGGDIGGFVGAVIASVLTLGQSSKATELGEKLGEADC